MNTLKIKKILLITAIISSILSCTMFFIIKLENSMCIMYYPFELVGKIIRSLSLSSSIGNIVSWIIYIGICMIPTFIYFYKYKKVDFMFNSYDNLLNKSNWLSAGQGRYTTCREKYVWSFCEIL